MSTTALDPSVGVGTHSGASTTGWDRWSVARIKRIGFVLFGLQLVGLFVWSDILANRFALTFDFSIYHQAWWLIGHGHLNPFDTVQGFSFWQGHGEFLLWPMALVGDLWPHTVTMLWIQDLGTVGAEVVAFTWLCDFASGSGPDDAPRSTDPRIPAVLAATGALLLIADPWIYWSVSWDFHSEMFGILFVLLAARDLYRDPQRKRTWVWVVLGLACGDVIATYLVAVGVSGALAGKRWRHTGLWIAAAGLVWTLALTALGAHKASHLNGYGYLAVTAGQAVPASFGLVQVAKGIAHHPANIVRTLWGHRLDLYAVIAASGLIGVVFPWVVVPVALVLVENGLDHNPGLVAPSFQYALLLVLVPVGTVGLLASIARRHVRTALVLALILALNVVAWSVVWTPRTTSEWLRVSPGAASVLAKVQSEVPTDDEMIVSQGVVGRFAGRTWIYNLLGPGSIPVDTPTVWVVVAPNQGIETAPVTVANALIATLAGPLHARLVTHGHGVWAFRWTPPPGTRSLDVPSVVPTVEAWTATGDAGTPTTEGPTSNWRAVANGKRGYVVSGDYWRAPPGRYQATVTLSSTVPVNVEVWDATSDELLARRTLPPTSGTVAESIPVQLAGLVGQRVFDGVGPFRILPVPPPPYDELEIRVWTPGNGVVSVASLELVPVPGAP